MHAGRGTHDCGEKRNILIVSILLLIGSNLTLRSNLQGCIQVQWVCEQTVLLHVTGRPKPVMGDAGTREEPGTLTQGAPVFPGSSRLGMNPKLQGGWCKTQPPGR
jgi:hypothetical protein